jgi:hypothetical protein
MSPTMVLDLWYRVSCKGRRPFPGFRFASQYFKCTDSESDDETAFRWPFRFQSQCVVTDIGFSVAPNGNDDLLGTCS